MFSIHSRLQPTTNNDSDNHALIIIKPHANNPAMERFVREHLQQHKINIMNEGILTAAEIEKNGLVDRHYFSIARLATLTDPSKISISEESENKFQKEFFSSHESNWNLEVHANRVMNARQALQKIFSGDIQAMENFWEHEAKKIAKLAPGFYVAFHEKSKTFIINGFYMAMRSEFVAPGSSIRWFHVDWAESALSWSEFREKVVGKTNPEKAESGSMRREALERWKNLGLQSKPSVAMNCIHASAGPLEGLNERLIWMTTTTTKTTKTSSEIDLDRRVRADPFGKTLLDAGVELKMLQDLLKNPLIKDDASKHGKQVPVFDLLEEKQSSTAVNFLVNYGTNHHHGGKKILSSTSSSASTSTLSNSGEFHELFKNGLYLIILVWIFLIGKNMLDLKWKEKKNNDRIKVV